MSDDAFDEFSRNICAYYGVKYTPPAVRQRPIVVTPENAAQFQPVPKRRGRKPNVVLGGNVVAFAKPEKKLPLPPDDPAIYRRARNKAFFLALEAINQWEWHGKRGPAPEVEDFVPTAWAALGFTEPDRPTIKPKVDA
ncbi:hypothetical protein [Tahibacter harae]|nr:hypothetical protein [Tahibacter harae]